MASLQQNNINETYEGLLKTFDNNTITISNRVTDGKGQCTALTLGSTSNSPSLLVSIKISPIFPSSYSPV